MDKINKTHKICINCDNSRQAGDKDSTDVVGCRLLNLDKIKREDTTGTLYDGWFYGGRRPGDIAESDVIGKGVISRGILIDAKGYCKAFFKRNDKAYVPTSKEIIKFNCNAAKTVLDVTVRNVNSEASASQYSNIKTVIDLLNEALKET